MAEARPLSGIHNITSDGVRSMLDGDSLDDSQRTLPPVPEEPVGGASTSGLRQNLSASFQRLSQGLKSRLHRQQPSATPNQPQAMDTDSEPASPNTMRLQLSTYERTVQDLYAQNTRNAEMLGRLETLITEKEEIISSLQQKESEKDLQLAAKERDFNQQLSEEKQARENLSALLNQLQAELNTLKNKPNEPTGVRDEAHTNVNEQLRAIEEQKQAAENYALKLKAEYDAALKAKDDEVQNKIVRMKESLEEKQRLECEAASKASDQQLQTIMAELKSLKDHQDRDMKERKADEQNLLASIKSTIDPILTSDGKLTAPLMGEGAKLKSLREEVQNFCPKTVNTRRGAAISTDDTIGDWTLPSNKHVHFQSTPVKRPKTTGLLGEGNLDFSQHQATGTIPKDEATATIAESILQNTVQNIASEFKKIREPKIQRFRGGTSSGALLVFNNWIQDIESTIADRNLDRQESFRLIKDFSEASARDNINFYLESTENPTVEGLFENLRQAFSAGEDGQQMLAEFYSRHQGPKESVKEFGESLLQIARKIMTSNKDFKKDVDNSLKARFADGLKDQYHQALAREMIRNRPTLSYVAFKAEVLKTLGPSAGTKSKRLEVNQTDVSVDESPPKKRKHESEMSQQINAVLDENRKLAEKLNALDPKLIAESVANAVQSSSGSKPSTFSNHSGQKSFKPTQFYGKQKEPELAPGVDGSLKPDVNCNYCKDLGHMKFNCPKLKEKEACMAGRQSQQFKKGN